MHDPFSHKYIMDNHYNFKHINGARGETKQYYFHNFEKENWNTKLMTSFSWIEQSERVNI